MMKDTLDGTTQFCPRCALDAKEKPEHTCGIPCRCEEKGIQCMLHNSPFKYMNTQNWERELLKKYFVSRFNNGHVGAQIDLIVDVKEILQQQRKQIGEHIIRIMDEEIMELSLEKIARYADHLISNHEIK